MRTRRSACPCAQASAAPTTGPTQAGGSGGACGVALLPAEPPPGRDPAEKALYRLDTVRTPRRPELFAREASGTYCNQWMVGDLRRFRPRAPLAAAVSRAAALSLGSIALEPPRGQKLKRYTVWSAINCI